MCIAGYFINFSFNCVDNSGATSGITVAARNFFGVRKSLRLVRLLAAGQKNWTKKTAKNNTCKSKFIISTLYCCRKVDSCLCQVTHVTDLMFILIWCLFNNQIVSVAHSRVTFWLPPRCEPV